MILSHASTGERYRRALIILFILAVAVRLFFVIEYDPGLRNDSIGMKGPSFVPLSYRSLAMGILNQDLTHDVGARSPGYPAVIAASFYLFGVDNYEAIVLIQTLFGVIIFFASYWLWSQLYGKSLAALAATAVTAFEPALVLAEDQILSETLTVMLLILSLALLINAVRREKPSAWIALSCGLCVAWLALTRPAFQLIIPLYVLYILIVLRHKMKAPPAWASVLLFTAVSVLPVIGWNTFNYHRFGYFTLMTTQGYILSTHTIPLIGGHPEKYGEVSDIARILDNYHQTVEGQSIWLAYPEIMEKRQVSFVEGSRLVQELSYQVIIDNLASYLRSVLHSISGFWTGRLDPLSEFENSFLFKITSALYDFSHSIGVFLFFFVIILDLIRPKRWLEPVVLERVLMVSLIALVCVSSTVPIAFENARYKIPLHPLIWGMVASSLVVNWPSFRQLYEKWR